MVSSLIQPNNIPVVINPGFESGLEGWISRGIVKPEGRSGGYCLVHGIGAIESIQKLEKLPSGWYTLRVWVRTNAILKTAYIALTDSTCEPKRVSISLEQKGWLQIVASTEITGGACTISLYTEVEGDGWVAFDDIALVSGQTALSIMGADISSLKKSEDMGGVYYDALGIARDALTILHEHGMNYARLRVWVNAPDGYHGKAQILEIAQRLKALEIKLLVDFHYSDSWADPGKQNKPEAWQDLDFAELKQAVYTHTFDICNALKAQATPADMVQIGNEINHGMLWPDGKNDHSFDGLATLLKEGVRAVKDCSPVTRIMLHLAEGGNNKLFRWWLDAIIEQGVTFDLIGVSYYAYWHGTLVDLQHNLNDIALRYQKDIILVETSYPFTHENDDATENIIRNEISEGYPATPEGQKKNLMDILSIIRAVPDGRGLGFFWWEAPWTAVQGNGWDPADPTCGNNWENQALFDFDDRPLPAMELFSDR
jgi:arabinogalactan endo-1,4-beta-galactosidase